MSTTPIEDRIAWNIHRQAFDVARARGADFPAATLAGFAATDAQISDRKSFANKSLDVSER